MAYTTIDKSSLHFNTVLYSGTGSSQSITGVGFQPDWLWQKSRSNSQDGRIFDAVRGGSKLIYPSLTNAEATDAQLITSFDSDGFTMGSSGTNVNDSGTTNVAWNWKANGAGSSNTEGDITATVSANTTSGFSIIKFTSAGSVSQTYGHGLNGTPKLWIIKDTSQSSNNWQVYYKGTDRLKLDTDEGSSTTASYLMSANATTITTPSNADSAWGNGNGINYITYAFQEILGFSKIGTYTGRANADNAFAYTGFKPSWIMIKKLSGSGYDWMMFDTKRNGGSNPYNDYLKANESIAEVDNSFIDILSNGFKIRTTDGHLADAGEYLYIAFAEAPLVGSNNVPCTAR